MKLTKLLFVSILLLFTSIVYGGSREDWQAVVDAMALTGYEAAAADIEAALGTISDEELELLYGQTDLAELAKAFADVAEAMDACEEMNTGALEFTAPILLSAGLPGAVGYPSASICPFSPDRSDADALLIAVDAIAASNIALEIAWGVWSVADRACGTVVVAMGAGGNPQNVACIASDAILYVAQALVTTAKAVVDHIAFCDGAVDSAEIEGAYERAGHIHTDLVTHDEDISNQLATHDEDISNQLATHDADIKELLGEIQETVDENQRLIKISMSRQLDVMRLLITPSGKRVINEDVLTCTGDNCPVYPALQLCPNGSLSWNCGDDD